MTQQELANEYNKLKVYITTTVTIGEKLAFIRLAKKEKKSFAAYLSLILRKHLEEVAPEDLKEIEKLSGVS
jgi:hypothetical protein